MDALTHYNQQQETRITNVEKRMESSEEQIAQHSNQILDLETVKCNEVDF